MNNVRKKVRAEINLANLRHNLARVRELAAESRIISVIKANAYGHGVFPIVRALENSDVFAVARLDEALELRHYLIKENINKPILILEGISSIDDYIECEKDDLIPTIHCLEQFKILLLFFEKYSHSELIYWLKVDTGMHRLGLLGDDWKIVLEGLKSLETMQLPQGVMSHFACADEMHNPANKQQTLQFEKFYSDIEEFAVIEKSMANSAAVLSMPETHFGWVRPGIMLYGVSPFEADAEARTGLDEQLKAVMTLSSELISIKALKQGDCIGYGSNWCCPEDMTIGVVAIGYGDGYPRHAKAGTPVLIHGIEVPLVGRVSMDMITIDLGCFFPQHNKMKALADVSIGDRVILWGDGLAIEKVSQNSATIAYELLCQITQRVEFQYV
ncbi:MAG: alanine racemase [gamma proteobacterium symbiont of Taylorina sp.]|nr:alanine racemase [gamma proteobacterium symbiont of Taylorina sp.]